MQPQTGETVGTTKDMAIYYANLGWHVFPLYRMVDGSCTCSKGVDCKDAGKHPKTPHGFKDATIDPETIERWWTVDPRAGLGVRTGEISGFDVLDVDVKDGGLETLNTFEKHNGPLPETVWEVTGGGGRHYLFRHREGQRRRIKFLPGLDVLGDDGYMVIAPSAHKSGGYYRWQTFPLRDNIAEWPASLLQMIGDTKREDNEAEGCEIVVANPPSYVSAAVKAILQTVKEAQQGERHNTLVSQSFVLGRYVGEYLTEDEARDGLIDCVASWGSVPGHKEMGAIKWGLELGQLSPKKVIQTSLAIVPMGTVLDSPVELHEKLPLLPEKSLETFLERNELGDAEMLARLFHGRLYVLGSGVYVWGRHRWKRASRNFVYALITNQVADQWQIWASRLGDRSAEEVDMNKKQTFSDKAKFVAARASYCRNSKRAEGVFKLFAGLAELPEGWQWDSDPWILAVENGVIDLKTGELREGRPEDRVLVHVPVEYRGREDKSPLWEKTLGEIFADQPDMVPFMQRLLGYGLTGLSQEHILPVLWGEGRNGKDTIIETLGKVLGEDVASVVNRDVFLGGKFESEGRNGAASPHLMGLRGKRLVWCSEATGRFNVEQVKLITGGNIIRGRQLYGQEEQFLSTHLPLLITNDKPSAPPDATALWDRLILISFNQRFVDEPKDAHEHKKDAGLKDRLREEASGILAWLVRGCLEWQQKGLEKPGAVIAATKAYQHENDLLGQFLEEFAEESGDYSVPMSTLYASYSHYLTHVHGYSRLPSSNSVGKQMSKKYKSKRGNKGMIYTGVRLRMTPDEIFSEVVRLG